MSKEDPVSIINRNGPDNTDAATGFRTTLTRLPSARRVGRMRSEDTVFEESSGTKKRTSFRTTLDFASIGHDVLAQAQTSLFREAA